MPIPFRRTYLLAALILAGCATIATPPAIPDKVDYTWVTNGDPQTYAQLAEHLFDVRAAFAPDSLCIVVKGPPNEVAAAITMISKLETTPFDDGPGQYHLFAKYLKNANAAQVVATLESMQQKGFHFSERAPWGRPLSAVEYAPKNMLWIQVDKLYEDRVRGILDELDSPRSPATQPPEIRSDRGIPELPKF